MDKAKSFHTAMSKVKSPRAAMFLHRCIKKKKSSCVIVSTMTFKCITKNNNMKNYFMSGTDDQLNFGDMIELDFTKDMPNGSTAHHHMECKFLPPMIPLLLELGAIEEREVEEETKREILDFCDEEDDCIIEEILKQNETLEKRIEMLEHLTETINKRLAGALQTIKIHDDAIESLKEKAHVHNVPKHTKHARKDCCQQED